MRNIINSCKRVCIYVQYLFKVVNTYDDDDDDDADGDDDEVKEHGEGVHR